MASGISSFVVRLLGIAPFRAIFLWLGARFESVIRTYFFLRQKLLPPGAGVGDAYQAILEDGLQRARPAETEAMLDQLMRSGDPGSKIAFARWAGRRLAADEDPATLEATLETALENSTPARKQHFY